MGRARIADTAPEERPDGARSGRAATDKRGLWPGESRGDAVLWLGLLAGFILIYLLFWPAGPGIHDEAGFINQALLWTRPSLSESRAASAPVDDLLRIGDRTIGWRNPGRSLLLIPFLPFGATRALYLSSVLLHLATALVAAALLRRSGRSPLWASLVLFHPTLLLYSRTIMADGPAGLAVLVALLALTARRNTGLLAGLALGAAAACRYQVGLLLLPLAAGILTLPRLRDRWRQAAACLAGGAAAGAALMAYNWIVYRNILGYTGQGRFHTAFLGWNAGAYAVALSAFWPVLPAALVLDRSAWRWMIRLLVIPFLVVMLFYSWHDVGSGPLDTSVLSLRLLQPVLPVWVLSYALLLDDRLGSIFRRRLSPTTRRVMLLASGVCLLAGQAVLFQRHQAHVQSLQDARRIVLSTVPSGSTVIANGAVRKLFALLDTDPPAYRWIPYDRDNRVLDPARAVERSDGPLYVVLLPKRPGYEFPGELAGIVRRLGLHRVPVGHPTLMVYRAEPRASESVADEPGMP